MPHQKPIHPRPAGVADEGGEAVAQGQGGELVQEGAEDLRPGGEVGHVHHDPERVEFEERDAMSKDRLKRQWEVAFSHAPLGSYRQWRLENGLGDDFLLWLRYCINGVSSLRVGH